MISALVYRKPMHTDLYLHYSSKPWIGCKKSVVSSFNRAYSTVTYKDDLAEENARMQLVLKKNWYHESNITKILKKITNCLSQSQWQMSFTDIQEEEIRWV